MIRIDKIEILFKMNVSMFNIASKINSLAKFHDFSKSKEDRIKNLNLIKKKKSKKCYIVGLGPSLNDVDLTKLEADSIVVNHFYNIGKNINFTPTFFLAVDNAFAEEEHINSLHQAMNLYQENTSFIFSNKIIKSLNKPLNSNLYTVVGGGKLFDSSINIDFTKRYPIGFNVVADAIMLALYLGYSEIVLLGADFNSFASRKPLHAYHEKDENRKIELWKELFCYAIVAHVHKELDKYSKEKEVKIINATRGSLIDSYQYDENYIYNNKIAKDEVI